MARGGQLSAAGGAAERGYVGEGYARGADGRAGEDEVWAGKVDVSGMAHSAGGMGLYGDGAVQTLESNTQTTPNHHQPRAKRQLPAYFQATD